MTAKETKDKIRKATEPKAKKYISTGCWLVNLALSDNVDRGIEQGSIVNLCGESHTGKSLICGNLFGHMSHNATHKDFKLIYDDAEGGFRFPKEYFGPNTFERMVLKNQDEDNKDESSKTVQDLELSLREHFAEKEQFVYVVDSMDKLTTLEDLEKTDELLDAYVKGKSTTGTYNLAKNKYLTGMFSRIAPEIHKSNSVLFIISHTKQKITGMGGKYRSGGVAMKYYSDWEAWLNAPMRGAKIKKTYNGKEDIIGSRVMFKISKSRMSGKPREVTFSILNDYGIDNIRTSLEWLQEYKYAEELKKVTEKKLMEAMIADIEDNGKEEQLKEVLQACWTDRETHLKVERKSQW